MTLARLAARHGVATSYSPAPGRTVHASDTAVAAALAALGVDAASAPTDPPERLLPPTVVAGA
ncbi:hypothetical protein ABZY90_38830, partial [Streptomyces sp. NPDC006422]|uniref:hypothetical protein n=1 Tax=Streptomyces sp. NPDC006422 TaxID=3155457 RepID=UPI0033B85937